MTRMFRAISLGILMLVSVVGMLLADGGDNELSSAFMIAAATAFVGACLVLASFDFDRKAS